MDYKTPGVYVEEISIFPPSVAEVETAIPAFVGYTEKAERRGESLWNVPTKIKSLLEFRNYFGGAFDLQQINVAVNENNNYAVSSVSLVNRFYLYDSLRLFFDNGGGDCYIVAVNSYIDNLGATNTIAVGDENDASNSPGLRVGVAALAQYDEPTMILFPDAVALATHASFSGLQQMALSQCANLQDRVAILDLMEGAAILFQDSVDNFRNGIGINNLKYGASYTPYLYNAFDYSIPFSIFDANVVNSSAAAVDLATITTDSSLNALVAAVRQAVADVPIYDAIITALRGASPTVSERYRGLRAAIASAADNGQANAALEAMFDFLDEMVSEAADLRTELSGTNLLLDLNAYATDSGARAIESLLALQLNASSTAILGAARDVNSEYTAAGMDIIGVTPNYHWLAAIPAASTTDYTQGGALTDNWDIGAAMISDINTIFNELLGFLNSVESAAHTHVTLTTDALYENHTIIGNIVRHIQRNMSIMPPSGVMAGLYTMVDNQRGVWKAPANVSVSSVVGPTVVIDDNGQESLNVDVTAGKSVNAIRAFTGKGTLVWGARTLAGNDNEWRYISVRRFFNMVEESVKKSTGWAVFEPNDANTWAKVRSMIDNYLLLKWKDGALQGAAPEDAYFVKVGLGLTMTAQDVLEGRMIVEIGMAVVRPAEFIILKFSHKMVES
ncbi:MAG: phage tail sheath C-terminal domain-containing protein [Bacteroidota bacterium]